MPDTTPTHDAGPEAPCPTRTTSDGPGSPPSAPAGCVAAPPGYEVLEELGRGGAGVVYRARHLALNRVVALKMLLGADLSDPCRLARFRVEAEAVAAVRHPNVVQVYEVGEHEGRPFMALEHLGASAGAAGSRPAPRPTSSPGWPRRSRRPTTRASSTATSSRPTSCSRAPATRPPSPR